MSKATTKSTPPPGRRGRGYVEKPQNFGETMGKLSKYLKPHYFAISMSAIMAITASLLTVLGPWLLGLITSEVFDAYKESRALGLIAIGSIVEVNISVMAIILVSIYFLSSLFNYLQAFLLIVMTQNLTYGMRIDLAQKINKLPLSYFDTEPFGDILSKVTNDVETINMTLSQSLSEIFRGITMIIAIIVMMFLLQWILALIVLVTTVSSFLVARFFVKKSQRYFRMQAQSYGQLTGHIEEVYSGHSVVKIFDYQKTAEKEFKEVNKELYDSSFKSQFISGIMMPVQFFIGNVAYILITFIGALLYITINMPLGTIQTFIQYTRQINQPIQSVGNIANVLQSTAAAAERIFLLLDEEEETAERENLVKLNDVKGNVEFNNIHFRYLKDIPVIQDFTTNIKSGQTVAIVGPTGAGKTTIVNLLMRFYEVDEGSIKIDGIDIRDMHRSDVRSMFAMVLQDTWLFEGTIYENLSYGEKSTLEEVKEAAKLSQVDYFIESLAGGYDFMLSEGGTNLSQGQRQLLTICRAMLENSPMLILDEATSNVDTRTEVLIQKAMEQLMENRTSFVIAHRLSTIRDADLILVLKDGNIIEQGTHDELIAQKGFYEGLYLSQFDK